MKLFYVGLVYSCMEVVHLLVSVLGKRVDCVTVCPLNWVIVVFEEIN